MTVAISTSRDKRGTKRTCVACDIRFYDLARAPIVCPACGGEHIPLVQAPIEARPRSFSGTASWNNRGTVHRAPPQAEPAAAQIADSDDVVAEDLEEEAAPDDAGVVSDDDTVLEPEADDADASALVEHDVDDPKDQ